MKDIQQFFKMGMDRVIPELKAMPDGPVLNLGSGNKVIPGTINLDLPDWNADENFIPFSDDSIAGIYAFHFLEHIKEPIKMLAEMQRVLVPGGIVNICVPYYTSQMAHHDLDHKHWYTEATWQNTFNNPYYDKAKIVEWKFDIGFNLICGIVERNTCLLTQLIKRA